MIRTKLSLPALILVAASCVAGIGCGPGVTEPEGPAVSLWGRWEQSFSSPDADPGRTNLTVQLRSPSGEQREAAGFWDGGTTWRVRFMPDEEGTWRYETKWQPAANGAGPTSGFFACARKASDGNPFAEHGPIQVSGDGRYFVHADGTPFFWLADTAWNGALLSTREDWSRYLDDRVTKRFSAIQFVTTQWRTAYQNLRGSSRLFGAGEHYDPSRVFPTDRPANRRDQRPRSARGSRGALVAGRGGVHTRQATCGPSDSPRAVHRGSLRSSPRCLVFGRGRRFRWRGGTVLEGAWACCFRPWRSCPGFLAPSRDAVAMGRLPRGNLADRARLSERSRRQRRDPRLDPFGAAIREMARGAGAAYHQPRAAI